ncbi:MAG: alpha/beta hydrolase [Verrucomicrobia bacterium]|nr:alpha/beta hydrolase [Verrucomicrobiota bacterium]
MKTKWIKYLGFTAWICGAVVVVSSSGGDYATRVDIPYYDKTGSEADAYIHERCVLDIYHPVDVPGYPTVVWFHGGGLTSGQKSIPTALKNKGIGIVAVNYRLHPRVTAPKYIEDAAAAVSWVFSHVADFGGDTSMIFVSGHSAGGYLASMIGLDKKWLNAHQVDANNIAGLIPFSGHTITHFTVRKERGYSELQPVVDELAPLFHVRADAPPLLLITGDRELEMLGRYEENAYLMRMMKVAGHPSTQLFELDGYGHGMSEPAFPLLLNEIHRIQKKTHHFPKGSQLVERVPFMCHLCPAQG